MIKHYFSGVNYIGNADWIYNLTDKVFESCSGINYSAYWHDNLYKFILFREKYFINKLILKMLLDLLFLVIGFFRCLRNGQVLGLVLILVFYIALLVNTPVYLWRIRHEG